jgi:hypothetical protein
LRAVRMQDEGVREVMVEMKGLSDEIERVFRWVTL